MKCVKYKSQMEFQIIFSCFFFKFVIELRVSKEVAIFTCNWQTECEQQSTVGRSHLIKKQLVNVSFHKISI